MKNKKKLDELIVKYNDVLYESMKISLAEDLMNLIITNRDDLDQDLKETMQEKREFKEYVIKQFFKNNYKPVTKELSSMTEEKIKLPKHLKSKQRKVTKIYPQESK
ncbi:MAG: hypothetical protein MRY83_18835 [Flavobacteriales bacterium]|nr:hypothetical protein [Flavobacteriales bacterium]